MARNFNGTTDGAVVSIGALGVVAGPITIAAIVKRNADGVSHVVLDAGSATSGTARWGLRVDASNKIAMLVASTSQPAPTLSLVVADGWALIAATKATGSVHPRLHKVLFSNLTASHEDKSVNVADSTAPATSAYLGRVSANTVFWNGDIAMAGVWGAVLTDQQIESLAYSLRAWFQNNPKGLWLLDQAATTTKVLDITGGHADESALTGTTVSTNSVPIFNRGLGPSQVSGAAASTTPALTGSSDGVSSTAASLIVTHKLTGSTAGAATSSGTLKVAHPLTGATAGASTDSATLTVAHKLTGSTAGTSSTTGTLKVAHTLTGSTSGTASTTGAVQATHPLTGTTAGASTTAGTVKVTHALTASTTGTSTTTASLKVSHSLSGSAAGVSSTSGAVREADSLTGTTPGVSSTSANLKTALTLTGATSGISATNGALRVTHTLTGSTSGVSSASGNLIDTHYLVGSTSGAATITGVLATGAAISPTGGSLTKPRLHLGNFPGRKELAADGTLAYRLTLYGTGEPELPDNLTFPAFSGDGEICGEHRDLRSLTICTRSEMRGAGRLNTHPARNGTGTASEDADDILVLLSP